MLSRCSCTVHVFPYAMKMENLPQFLCCNFVFILQDRGELVFPSMFISLLKLFVKFSHFQLLSHSLNGHMFTISYTVGYRKLLALNKVNVDITENATCILNLRKYVCFLLNESTVSVYGNSWGSH